ncbi:MAG: MFS transporter [SAR202 cluster bacterium]|nr:MFS transporter [SAR202 cluster bacterium]
MTSFVSRTFSSLAVPQYRVLWLGTVFMFLAFQMQMVARGFLAWQLTHSNSALAGLMLAFGIPQLLLSLVGGVFADRFPKRVLLLASQGLLGSLSAWIAIMIELDAIAYWHLVVATALLGVAFAFAGPARQAFTTDIVGRAQVANAIVLTQLGTNGTRVIGPAVAGALVAVAVIGVSGVYWLTTAGFVAGILMTWRLPRGESRRGAIQVSAVRDLRDGIAYVVRYPALLLLTLSSLFVMMFGHPYMAFLPSLTDEVFDSGAAGFGALNSVAAVGAVLATVVVAGIASHRRAPLLEVLAGAGFGAALILLGLSPGFAVALLVMAGLGACNAVFTSLNSALSMQLAAEEFHGRVLSINALSFSLFGLAALPIGVFADRVGLRETFVLMGVLVLLSVLAIDAARHALRVRTQRPPGVAIRAPVAAAEADPVA